MDFSRGLLIPEEKQKQQQNQNRPWIPITPSKLIPTREEESVSVYTQGNQPGTTTNFLRQAMFDQGFFSEIPNSNGIVENFNSVSSLDHRDFLSNNWEAATTAAALGSNNRGDLGSDKAAWNDLACSDLLALAEAASGASKASASGSDRGNNNAASTSSVPFSCSQIQTNLQQQPDLASMLFQNQNISVSSSMLNNNSPLQLPHYGYSGSYIPSYDLNSLPNLNDTLLDGLMSYQFEPFTPDHSKRLKKSIQVSKTVNACLDEQIIQENNKQQEAAVGHTGNVVPELISNQPTSAPVDSLNAGLSTQMNKNLEAVKGGDNGIDLNTPPQRQKPKRKKYTPKVVREGKPKSTPKPKTPKQASTTENPTGRRKRKYVRKTGPKASENPSVECVKDTVNSTSESAARSCKRSFNFDSDSRARDESHGTILDLQKHLPSWNVNRSSYMWDFGSNSGIQAKDVHTGDNSGSPTKSLLPGTQGWEVIVENSRAKTAFDLNHYSTEKQCISLPEQSSSELSPSTETELKREYLKVHSREINVTRTADECVSSAEIGCPPIPQQIHTEEAECIALPTKTAQHCLQSMSTRQTDSSNGSNGTEQARGSKREYGNMSNTSQLCSLNLLGAQFNSLQAYHEIFQKIHKKKRTEKVHNTVTSSLLSPNKAVEVGSNGKQTMSRRLSDPNSIYFASQVKSPQSAPRSNNTIGTTYIRNNISNSGSTLRPHSMPVGHNPQVQNSSAVISHVEALRGVTLDKLPEFMLSSGETGWRTKRRSKGSTWARNSASLSALFQCNKMPSTPPKTEQKLANGKQVQIFDGPLACIEALAAGTHAKLPKKKRSRKGAPMARSASYSRAKELGLHEHEAASYEYRQSFAKYRGISLPQKITGSIASSRSSQSLSINATFERQSYNRDIGGKFHAGPSTVTNDYLITIHNYLIAVDELVNKFRCLSIDSNDWINMQEQNAMVLFGKADTMVPYEGPFDPIKRRKPRAKVDLDPETDRVWRSLMGKECRLSIEGTGEDKEKWWEEERRIFRGRADSFIARMHLVQGDRRFTQWKGSVVDSVIGVFLTQNVSDHLSSSAFMSLAARFPLPSTSNHRAYYEQRTEVIVEEPEGGIADADDSGQWHEKMSTEAVCDQGYIPLDEVEHIAEREVAECIDSFGSNKGDCRTPDNSKGKQSAFCKSGLDNLTTETEKSCSVDSEDRRAVQDVVSSQNSVGSSENSACSSILQTSDRSLTLTRISTCLVEARNSRALEDVVSSQNCDTSILQTAERSCSDSNSEAEDVMTGCKSNSYDCSTSFTRLLHMAGTNKLQEYYSHGQESFSPEKKLDCGSTQSESTGSERSSLEGLDCLRDSFHSIYPSNSKLPHQGLIIPSSNYHLQKTTDLGRLEVQCLEVSAEQRKLSSISTASEITDRKGMDSVNKQNCLMEETVSETTVLSVQAADLVTSLSNHSAQTLCSSGQEAELEKHSHSCNNFEVEQSGTLQPESTPSKEPENLVEKLAPRRSNELQQGSSSLPECPIENSHVEETVCLMTQKTHTDNKDMASNLGERVLPSDKACSEAAVNTLKVNGKQGKEKKPEFDWDSLRKDAYLKGTKRERTMSTMDTLDYEALRCAEVGEIAASIKERGMNNMLAERIKDFLNRLVRDHENIDLEWLKDVPPDKAKEYLLSIRGLGLKSVECVRLLTLHQLAFPVDVNVGRIAVRLGWVPLQPLPESLQLHLLELYPMQETIQKYLWPRLCTLDQRTLYELHYQMITFGKVFCTKSKPNCNACPLRAECKHFASAFASARLALPAPEEKGMVPSTAPIVADKCPPVNIRPMQITLPGTKIVSESRSNECEPIIEEPEITLVSETISGTNECKPIIEEPASPEIRTIEISESDMEDAFNEDPDEIPTINVSMAELTTTLTNYLQETNKELQADGMSKALIALTPEAASIPMPKLKNVGRLRTEHEVYVLPDSHPLLIGMDRREPDDPSSYLLAIWTPGETPESTEPPKICCGSHESGNLCNEKTCFPCNSVRETKSQIVRGTILIPCKTAMRGSFPLNGTYFQVNEVFADHDSSQCPINVPREWLWNLHRRTVFFGTSVISIFKGLSTEVIQSCFWRGFVCVRGFDRTTRSPRPLKSRLHYTATRLKQEEEVRRKQ